MLFSLFTFRKKQHLSGVVQLMSFQVIEFLSLFSLFISGVMVVPRGAAGDKEEAAGRFEEIKFRLHWDCLQFQLYVYFLLELARVVLTWYFELYTKHHIILLELMTTLIDLHLLSFFGPSGSLPANSAAKVLTPSGSHLSRESIPRVYTAKPTQLYSSNS
eukprot:TRINITY_DN141_c0_g1_i2.p1 TRINITY_DN141_c0_g1~~TRINITY_DN141_c0_g1_i2.p1  ORF type:complete len:160 (+),score=7.54 TRINITY_DN141_c0_g1_i2:943-1422(+)